MFKAEIAAYSESTGEIFNAEDAFFEPLDTDHELLSFP